MSAPLLVSAFGTVFAIDPGGRAESFSTSIADVWSDARVAQGSPSATVVADAEGSDESAERRVHDELTRIALSSVRRGIWVLRAVAVADADGAVTLVLAGDDAKLERFATAAYRSPGFVSARFVGIDATGAVLPFREPSYSRETRAVNAAKPRELPATLRVTRILLSVEAVASSAIESRPVEAHHAAEALVASSMNLPRVPGPLRRVANLVETCSFEWTDVDHPFEWLQSKASGPTEPPSPWLRSRAGQPTPARPRGVSPTPDARYFRGAVLDSEVLIDGRCVVVTDDGTASNLRVMGAEETELWQRADGEQRTALGPAVDVMEKMVSDGLLGIEPAWRIDDKAAWVDSESRTTVLCSTSLGEPALALEGSAHIIWSVLAEERVVTRSRLLDLCAGLFDVEVEQIAAPVESLLTELRARGMVVRV